MRWALFKLIEFIGLNKLIRSRKWSKVNGGKMEAGKVGRGVAFGRLRFEVGGNRSWDYGLGIEKP